MTLRIAVFIDGGYVDKIIQNEYSDYRLDYLKLSEEVCKGKERVRSYYYHCMPYQSNPPTDTEKKRYSSMDKFVYTLRRLPRFEVQLGKLEMRDGRPKQKRVDILMAVDIVRMSWAHQIQNAVIFTGDSDLVPAVFAAKEAGVVVELYYSEQAIHDELYEACDDRYQIDQTLIDKIKR